MPRVQDLHCLAGHDWSRPATGGRPPIRCPDHPRDWFPRERRLSDLEQQVSDLMALEICERGWTPEDVDEVTFGRVGKVSVQNRLDGVSPWSIRELESVAEALGVPVARFFAE